MSDNEEIRYVSDSTLPNAGRVYDYLLGGDYNFEVDRKVADDLIQKIPFVKSLVRVVRWFLGNAIDRAFKMGFTQFLDFASGLPTVDHIHTRIPDDVKDKVKILYSDIDPITVQISREIIGINPRVKFIECDCRKPGILLESDIVKDFFDTNQKTVIGLSGIIYFLTDEQVRHTLKVLYEWAPKDSILFFCDFDIKTLKDDPDRQVIFKYYENMNQPIYTRSQEKMKEFIKPWKIKEPGLQILEKWLDLPLDIAEQWKKFSGGSYYGGFIEK